MPFPKSAGTVLRPSAALALLMPLGALILVATPGSREAQKMRQKDFANSAVEICTFNRSYDLAGPANANLTKLCAQNTLQQPVEEVTAEESLAHAAFASCWKFLTMLLVIDGIRRWGTPSTKGGDGVSFAASAQQIVMQSTYFTCPLAVAERRDEVLRLESLVAISNATVKLAAPQVSTRIAQENSHDEWGSTALHASAGCDDERKLVELLDAGACPNALDAMEETALHLAARSGSGGNLCRLLVQRGARTDLTNVYGCTPLQIARHAGNRGACVELLLHTAPA